MKGFMYCFVFSAFIAFSAYVGITETLCADIRAGRIGHEAQQDMSLSAAKCEGPFWKRL